MKPGGKKGGYSYTVTKDQIRKHLALTPEERLRWLCDMNRFLWEAMSEEAKAAREKFRKGEV